MADLLCYNRGCGKTYNPRDNKEDACTFHPGAPYFHDAYKGWTCCEKKTTDFTQFLSTPGCQKGKHSNVKPVEPENITGNLSKESPPEEVIEVRAPVAKSLPRPSFDSHLVHLKPTIAASLKQQLASMKVADPDELIEEDDSIKEGEPCKNGGCKATYLGESSLTEDCLFHPGVPIFHEGMKYWSCCQKKTSDFQSFLDQAGCSCGTHKWKKANEGSARVDCRYDWHQTATHVTIAVYAKKYDPNISKIQVNPIRLLVHIYFPEEAGSFDLDLELRGQITVNESSVNMMGTKLEIKLKKAEPGSWSRLEIPREVKKPAPVEPTPNHDASASLEDDVDALDLDDLEVIPMKSVLSNEASGGRSGAPIV